MAPLPSVAIVLFCNPIVIGKNGTREQVIVKYKAWLYDDTEVVNGSDPAEYRRWTLEQLPGYYRWGCHCKQKAYHGDNLPE